MAGTKDQTKAERNRRICLLRRNGFTYSEIATMENVSRVRVSQIVAETTAEIGEDEGRAEIASILEFAERKAVGLINDPGGVCGPNGRLVTDEDGVPVENKTVMTDALKVLVVIADRKSRLYGWDRPSKRQLSIEIPEAQRQMQVAFEEERQKVEAWRRAGGVVQGEVVREIPPAASP